MSGSLRGVRTVDPIGLVTVRGHTYLLATRSGESRTYRLSRMIRADARPDPAQRPAQVDLDRLWAERSAEFLSGDHLAAQLRVRPTRQDDLLSTVRAVRSVESQPDGWIRLEVTFEDLRHALWAVWQLETDAEVIAPQALRRSLHERAAALTARYRP